MIEIIPNTSVCNSGRHFELVLVKMLLHEKASASRLANLYSYLKATTGSAFVARRAGM
jgi:hypothetical protein